MYGINWTILLKSTSAGRHAPEAQRAPLPLWRLPRVAGTVWALGFTSLLTDVSSEMVASVLPVYLVLQLGLTPLTFGIVDGLYQGIAALVRIGGGILADRWRKYKEVAVVGYGFSALCRLGILAAGSAWTMIAAVVALDRIGKGIRTAPRDALLALNSRSHDLATVFGVHRSLDAAGAMLGPIVAFLILVGIPRGFDVLFVASFAVAVVGLGVLVLFVNSTAERTAHATPASSRGVLRLLRARRFRAVAIAALVLGIPTISDSFIFLSLQRRFGIAATAFPLFYVMTSLFTATFAMPLGRLADRFGRALVLLGGYALLAMVYATTFMPVAPVLVVLIALALLGAYYAATDGVIAAMAAAVLTASESGTGLGLVATATNVSRLIASALFGLLWTVVGVNYATTIYLAALIAAIAFVAVLLIRIESQGAVETPLGADA